MYRKNNYIAFCCIYIHMLMPIFGPQLVGPMRDMSARV